jgi:glutamate N-acetyltransferase/amino-acid N-acetyltransferase
MKVIKGGVETPKGYKTGGLEIGIKRKRKDLTILYSEKPANAAIMTTQNIVRAAPIEWCEKVMKKSFKKQAIVINSGNANACTGQKGVIDTEKMAVKTAKALSINSEDVLVASTGVIGVQLPVEKILTGIDELVPILDDSIESGVHAAEGIMTTDTTTKICALEIEIKGKVVTLGGIAKGSGMIHPNMATMLSFVTTDANIDESVLQDLLKEVTNSTYNMISVDGDTSTNDMVVVLANGMAENECITKNSEAYEIFKEAFFFINEYLAKSIIKDGEGASKFLEAKVEGTKTESDAKKLAKSVITSNLVKTAFFGEDANWGRIISAVGMSGVKFDPSKVTLEISSTEGLITLLNEGTPILFDEEKAAKVLAETEIEIKLFLQEGEASAKAWGCDLTYEYVKINGEYRT